MDKIEELLEEMQKDNTTLVITIIVGLIIYIILTLSCVALFNFLCSREVDEEDEE